MMSKMKELSATPLASYSHEWKVVPQQIVPIRRRQAAFWIAGGYGEDSRRGLQFSHIRH